VFYYARKCTKNILFQPSTGAVQNKKQPLILLGHLNTDFEGQSNNPLTMETDALIASLGVVNLNDRYKQRKGTGNWTCHQTRMGNHITSRCDHILTSDVQHSVYMKIKTPRFESDQRMLIAGLSIDTEKQQRKYLTLRSTPQLETNATRNDADAIMEELKESVPKPAKRNDQRYQSWISEETWRARDAKGRSETVRRHRKSA
jgi:hypothetical protein